jgi:hypothetical protein
MASSLIDVCRFNPTAGGTTDWTYSSAVPGYQSPTAAGATNGATYSYRAESADLTQWEVGTGAYNSGTGVFARTAVLFNSSGTTSKINFSAAPQVAIVALAEDIARLPAAWTAYTPTVSATAGSLTTTSTSGRYFQSGKFIHFVAEVTLTNVGTATGRISLTLPAAASSVGACIVLAMERQSTGIIGTGLISPSGTVALITAYNGLATTTIVNGYVWNVSGVYEAA